ncbi:hypothetical protein WME75_16300 [Sorangium sp. So ce1014]|uniref:hypothetical protein n=1 Tax=Sorangium sp. So ce1014 TaxID=3133326 RepID=UPI003F61BA04
MHRGGATPNATQDGSAAPPIDVSTTGSASGYVPQPVTTAPIDGSQNPYVQIEGGFVIRTQNTLT